MTVSIRIKNRQDVCDRDSSPSVGPFLSFDTSGLCWLTLPLYPEMEPSLSLAVAHVHYHHLCLVPGLFHYPQLKALTP